MRMGTEFAARFSLFFVVYLIASCLAYPLTSFKQNIRVQSGGIKSLDRITFRIVERENAKYRYSFPVSLSRDLVSSFLERFGATRNNPWYIWTILSVASSIGISSDKTRIGALLSSPLVTMALCLVFCNLGILPPASPVYSTISKVFVPLAVPLLLLDADIRKCFGVANRFLKAFLLGSIGTILGTLVAYWLVPMKGLSAGAGAAGGAKIAAALCARHIGGAVNFVSVSEILGVSPDLVAAAIAADNLIVAVYFSFLFVISAPSTDSAEIALPFGTSKPVPSEAYSPGQTDQSLGADLFLDSKTNEILYFEEASEPLGSEPPVPSISEAAVDSTPSELPATIIAPEVEDPLPSAALSSSIAPPVSRCPMSALFGSGGEDEADSGTTTPSPSLAAVAASYSASSPSSRGSSDGGREDEVSLASLSQALSAALLIASASMALSALTSMSSMLLLSAITVCLATAFPAAIGRFARAGGTLGVLFMQLFFAATGAVGHIPSVMKMAPSVLLHTAIQIAVHFLFLSSAGRAMGLPFREVVLASNANVGGPTTASAMAANKNWKLLVLPALLMGVLGFAMATQLGILVFQLLIWLG